MNTGDPLVEHYLADRDADYFGNPRTRVVEQQPQHMIPLAEPCSIRLPNHRQHHTRDRLPSIERSKRFAATPSACSITSSDNSSRCTVNFRNERSAARRGLTQSSFAGCVHHEGELTAAVAADFRAIRMVHPSVHLHRFRYASGCPAAAIRSCPSEVKPMEISGDWLLPASKSAYLATTASMAFWFDAWRYSC